MTIKQKLYQIIFEHNTRSGKNFDVALIILVLLSMLAVMLETIEGLWNNHHYLFLRLEWFFTIVFTIEFLLRLYCTPSKRKYVFSFYGMIDIVAILPTYLSVLIPGAQAFLIVRTMRLLRLFRILKLTNYTSAGTQLKSALVASKPKIVVFVFFVFALVTIVGTLMFYIEGRENGYTSIPKSIYWAIVTMTTVGYGDIAPQTPLGQFLSALLMITGYGVIAVPTGIISSEMAKMDAQEKLQGCKSCTGKDATESGAFCSHCGRNLRVANLS